MESLERNNDKGFIFHMRKFFGLIDQNRDGFVQQKNIGKGKLKDPREILKAINKKIKEIEEAIKNIQKKVVEAKKEIAKLKKDPANAVKLEEKKKELKELQAKKKNLEKEKGNLEGKRNDVLEYVAKKMSGKLGNEKSVLIKKVEDRVAEMRQWIKSNERETQISYEHADFQAIAGIYNLDNRDLQALSEVNIDSPYINLTTEKELFISRQLRKTKSLRARFPEVKKEADIYNKSLQFYEPNGKDYPTL